jgi:hypothetical protein
MCLLVSRCGPRKSMRVILGILNCSASGVEQKPRLLGPGSTFGEEAGLGCAGHWLLEVLVIDYARYRSVFPL